jgi:hypothetical protein
MKRQVWMAITIVIIFAMCAPIARADLVPILGSGPKHADPFPSPTNIYSTPLAPGQFAGEPVGDSLISSAPWLDDVEWVVYGAPGNSVNFQFLDGAAPVGLPRVQQLGFALYIYVAYTQPDDFGAETGNSLFTLGNLTPWTASYGLAVTEPPVIILPPPPLPDVPDPLNPTGPLPLIPTPTTPYNGATLTYDAGTQTFTVTVGTPEPSTVLLLSVFAGLVCAANVKFLHKWWRRQNS